MQKTLETFHSESCMWKVLKSGLLHIVVFFSVEATLTLKQHSVLKYSATSFKILIASESKHCKLNMLYKCVGHMVAGACVDMLNVSISIYRLSSIISAAVFSLPVAADMFLWDNSFPWKKGFLASRMQCHKQFCSGVRWREKLLWERGILLKPCLW